MLAGARPALALLALLRPHSPRRARSAYSLAHSAVVEDERFMRLALAQASLAFRAGEIPIGSVRFKMASASSLSTTASRSCKTHLLTRRCSVSVAEPQCRVRGG